MHLSDSTRDIVSLLLIFVALLVDRIMERRWPAKSVDAVIMRLALWVIFAVLALNVFLGMYLRFREVHG